MPCTAYVANLGTAIGWMAIQRDLKGSIHMIKLGKVSEQTRDTKATFPTEITGYPEVEI